MRKGKLVIDLLKSVLRRRNELKRIQDLNKEARAINELLKAGKTDEAQVRSTAMAAALDEIELQLGRRTS